MVRPAGWISLKSENNERRIIGVGANTKQADSNKIDNDIFYDNDDESVFTMNG
jgi:hypothetical protein